MSTDIAVVKNGSYLALNHTVEQLRSVIESNLGQTELSERNLPRVKIPAGGATTWAVPTPFGMEASEDLSGVVVSWKRVRAYWENPDPTGEPPACISHDTVRGIGKPGGACRSCPLAQWGSSPKSDKAQACKESEIWFLLRADGLLPIVLRLPATSLQGAEDYRISLASGGVPIESVQTTLSLRSEKGPSGNYSIAVPKFGGKLDDEDKAAAVAYAREFRPRFEAAAAEMAREDDRGTGAQAGAIDLDAA